MAVFHYIPLHSSPMGQKFGYTENDLPVTNDISGRLLRLPLFYDITEEELQFVVAQVEKYVRKSN
jgi:dTDP-4-amino-4,6-dideoxygalactose transaminase